MVTVRAYQNLAEATLAKCLLDDYELSSALFDGNAHLYGGAPLAMPVRLMVQENQLEFAIHILAGNLERAASIELDDTADVPVKFGVGNPWELLMIAFYFLLPGFCFLQAKYPPARQGLLVRREIAAVSISHFLGWIALLVAGFLVALYFYMSRFSDKTEFVSAAEMPKF